MKKYTLLVIALLLVALAMPASYGMTSTSGTLDWETEDWPQGSLNNSYTVSGENISMQITDSNGALSSFSTGLAVINTPVDMQFYQGSSGLANMPETLLSAVSLITLGRTGYIDYVIDLGEDGVGVANASFSLLDVDGEVGKFLRQERYEITGYLDGIAINPSLTSSGGTAVHEITGNVVRGLVPVSPNDLLPGDGISSDNGIVTVNFSQRVDQIHLRFSVDVPVSTTISPGSRPGFSISNISFNQETYTVGYEPGTQGTFTTQSTDGLSYGVNTPIAPDPTGNPGYEFTGWSPAVVDTVKGDATYVAQWTPIEYTVIYEPGTQGTFETQTNSGLHYGDSMPGAPTVTGKDGYEFIGWSPSITDKVTGNVTYVAQWKVQAVKNNSVPDTGESNTTSLILLGMMISMSTLYLLKRIKSH